MNGIRSGRWLGIATILALVVVALLFALQLSALASHRLDYPIVDDWRYYRPMFAMPSELTLEWLFHPAKDTLHVSGKLLDWLIFETLGHDYRVLAVTSFVLGFGGWLVATLGACFATTRNRPELRLVALVAFVLPLAACPFWVTVSPFQKLEPAIAYHQMLPMVGLAALAWIAASRRASRPSALVFAAASTIFFSLTYSSGAFALLVFGAALFASAWLTRRGHGGRLLPLAAIVTICAGVCLALHIGIPTAASGRNPVLETRAYEITLPFERNFWQFLLGLFDRAVLSNAIGWWPTLRGAIVALLVTVPFVGLGVGLVRGRLDEDDARAVAPLFAMFVAVLGFAALVTYGRGSFGRFYLAPADDPEVRATLYAHSRFFFWWITAVLPPAAIAWGRFLARLASPRIAIAVPAVLVALALVPKAPPSNQTSYYDSWRYEHAYWADAAKLANHIRQDRNAGKRRLTSAVARQRGASFPERWEAVGTTRQPSRRRR